jgi:hypothetical protein
LKGGGVAYPQFPIPKYLPTAPGNYPKYSYDELNAILMELSGLGLRVLPKKHDNKLPLWQFWDKDEAPKQDYSATSLMRYQQRSNVSGWCVQTGEISGRLMVLDFDTEEIKRHGNDPLQVYANVQEMSPTSFVLASPANGVHLYYRIPAEFGDMPGNVAPPVRGVDTRGEGGQVVTLGGFNRYDGGAASKKGVVDGHTATYEKLTDGRYEVIPFMTRELFNWVMSAHFNRAEKQRNEAENAVIYSSSPEAEARLSIHRAQPKEKQVAIVIEALNIVLSAMTPETPYEYWYKVWMAAHEGAQGDPIVRDYILGHPVPYWRDGHEGKRHFVQAWNNHKQRDGGYTAATLFYLATEYGWMQQTGYEIPDELCELIDTPRISDWAEKLETLPELTLLMSQTGSGKTQNLIWMWHKLSQPKTVVFVPSTKLAADLVLTLRNDGVPAELYIDPATGKTKAPEVLKAAHVLVTTLQTFGRKVWARGANMADYGLVYIEESDQLIQQFARGGSGIYSSHVRADEAKWGFEVLRAALESSGYVWAVDATMSKITLTLFQAMARRPVSVIRNTHVALKAPVAILASKDEAMTVILSSLLRNKKVVLVADTAAAANDTAEMMRGLIDKRIISITAETERQPEVVRFISNANEEAAKYDLVCYNSVMASGVSITAVTPDVVVQIANYLPPRVNIQLLNRYRKQKAVYVYYGSTDRIYSEDAGVIKKAAERRLSLEAAQLGIEAAARTPDAQLRAELTAMSQADVLAQMRFPATFYRALLRQDGRYVRDSAKLLVAPAIVLRGKEVRKLRAERVDYIRRNWRLVRPVDNENPADPDMTPLQVALGQRHAEIAVVLNGNIPTDVDDAEIDRIVSSFEHRLYELDILTDGTNVVQRAEWQVRSANMPATDVRTLISLMRVVSTVSIMFESFNQRLSASLVAQRVPLFLAEIGKVVSQFDALAIRDTDRYEYLNSIAASNNELAALVMRRMLKLVGLKLKVVNDGTGAAEWFIANAEDVQKLILWRNGSLKTLQSALADARRKVEQVQELAALVRRIDPVVLKELYNRDPMMTISTVVDIASSKEHF